MPLAKRFEDLNAWKKARQLTKVIYLECNKEPLRKNFGLRDQL